MDMKNIMMSDEESAEEKIIMPALYKLSVMDNRYLAESMSEYGLSAIMIRALSQIELTPGISQDTLAYYLAVDKATVTRTVDKLESSGLIARSISEKDRRCKLLYIKDDGAKMAAVIKAKKGEWRKILFDGMSKQQLDVLACLLMRMYNNAENADK